MAESSVISLAPHDALEGQFDRIRSIVYDVAGIDLKESKRDLVRSRLARRLRAVGDRSIRDYVGFVESEAGRAELVEMVDALTTNKTSFFREERHYDFLRELLAERGRGVDGPTMWSAGCSTGEEPYTLAMLLHERRREHGGTPGRILATDISGRALDKATGGTYSHDQVNAVPAGLRARYLSAMGGGSYGVSPELRRIVRFARLNLVGEWPMRGPFDVIFCRNVMIYFDGPTKERLVERFTSLLTPGGHLFVGHAESLSSLAHGLRYVVPAVYRRD